jgi:hypothetical protein
MFDKKDIKPFIGRLLGTLKDVVQSSL